MKKVLKFKFEEQEGFLSFVEQNDFYYTLVKKDTPKVLEIIKTEQLLISYEIKTPSYQKVTTKVSFDQTLIEWVYHKLEEEKNLYYKELDDSLCVLEILKDS